MAVIEELPRRAAGEESRTPISVLIDQDRCAGCQECLVRCPTHALSLDPVRWQVQADDAACVGCRQCERTCPFHAIEVLGPVMSGLPAKVAALPEHSLAFSTWETRPGLMSLDQARAEAERCLDCPDPTCTLGCPAHNDIPGFIRALAGGDIQGARDILAETSAFPEICSRVCNQATQCEGACSWTLAGGRPVSIGLLERFVADRSTPWLAAPTQAPAGLSVAVVGAGPGGIAAALGLRQAGAEVVLYERRSRPLGVLDWGIPAFTLPDDAAFAALGRLRQAGVKVELGVEVGGELPLETLRARHDAVVLAVGASQPLPLPIPAKDLDWVEDSTTFLVRAKTALRQGGHVPGIRVGARLLVLGAGNTAMDVARSAVRLGAARVVCVDWMDERFAPVRPDELEQARAEGVKIRFRTSLAMLSEEPGGAHVAMLVATEQRSARQRPRILRGAQERLDVDLVVVATGYRVEPELARTLGSRFPVRAPDLRRKVAPRSWMASGLTQAPGPVPLMALEREWHLSAAPAPVADGVWVVGDARSGPATVVAAMAQGLAAARAIVAPAPTPERAQALRPASRGLIRLRPPLATTSPEQARRAPAKTEPQADSASPAEGTLYAGLGLVSYGLVSCLTIVGAVLGIPMIVIGLLLIGADAVLRAFDRARGATSPTRRRLVARPTWAVRR